MQECSNKVKEQLGARMLLKVVAYGSLTLLWDSQFTVPAEAGWGHRTSTLSSSRTGLQPRPVTWRVGWFATSLIGELAKLCSGFLAGVRVSGFFGHVKLSLHLKWRTVQQTCFCCQHHSILITSKWPDHSRCEYPAPLNRNEHICVTGFVQPRQKCNTPPACQPLPHAGCCLKAPTLGLCWTMCSRNVPIWSRHGVVEHPVHGHEACVVWSVGLQDQLALRSSLPELCWPAQALTSVSDSKKMLLLQ